MKNLKVDIYLVILLMSFAVSFLIDLCHVLDNERLIYGIYFG